MTTGIPGRIRYRTGRAKWLAYRSSVRLTKTFLDEMEAWEHNNEEWSKRNEGKYLIIRGNAA